MPHKLGMGGEQACHAHLHTACAADQIPGFPWRLRQLKAGPVYTMASLRDLRGKIHPGYSCAGEWMLLSSSPPQKPLVSTRVNSSAADQNRLLAFVTAESRPNTHHGHPQSPTRPRQNSSGMPLRGGVDTAQ